MVWKFKKNAIRQKICRNCVYPQNFHTMKICEITLLCAVLYKHLFKVTIRTLVHCFSVFIVDFLSAFSRWLLLEKSCIFDNWQVMLTLPSKHLHVRSQQKTLEIGVAFFQSYNEITKTTSLTSFSCMYC